MGGIIIFDGYVGDLDRDGDNDGLDLAAYIFGNLEISLNVFAENFGESIQ